jgi:hypothetical protein
MNIEKLLFLNIIYIDTSFITFQLWHHEKEVWYRISEQLVQDHTILLSCRHIVVIQHFVSDTLSLYQTDNFL